MTDEAITHPTIQTLLERMDALSAEMRAGFAGIERAGERGATRLDRIESEVKKTGSEFYELRADFRELRGQLRGQLREQIPSLK
jgi:hypothetical protein